MYEPSAICETPPDDTRLWRYMDLGQFLYLLKCKELYFYRRHQLQDKWEGALRKYDLAYGMTHWDEEGTRRYESLQGAVASLAALSCWHQNDGESVAMWALYTHGKDGVAIATTVGRLKRVLNDTVQVPFHIGTVRYVDDAGRAGKLEDKPEPLETLFRKRKSFSHESEVRVVIPSPMTKVWKDRQRQVLADGVSYSINVASLVERIVSSPNCENWKITPLQQVVNESGIRVSVETSDLLIKPDAAISCDFDVDGV